MGLSTPNNYPDGNPGVTSSQSLGITLARPVAVSSPINQIRGVSQAGSTGAGVPKHVTGVTATVANATKGTTSTVTVSFRRDPSDQNFSGVSVYARGYQGNNALVKVGGGSDSPVSIVLNNTGESVGFFVQSNGNSGSAPLTTAPSTGVKLPKSTLGGYGTTTITTQTSSGGSSVTPMLCGIVGPGWPATHAVFGLSTTANGSLSTTNNVITAFKFDLLGTVTITKVGVHCVTATAGAKVNFGIYDVNGNKLVDSGGISWAASGLQSVTISSVTIGPGTFYFAQSADHAAVISPCLNLTVYDYADLLNLSANPVCVTAGNLTASNVMPASLGTLTADSSSGLQPGFAIFTS